MRKKTIGVVVGAGAGLGLLYLLRAGAFDIFDKEREIVIDDDGAGVKVAVKPADASLVSTQKITWRVTNQSSHNVKVSLGNWRDPGGDDNPAVNPAPDGNDPGQDGLSRVVSSGRTKKIRARAKAGYFLATFHYDVIIGETTLADPIIKLVL
jgi:hypothetical protein